MFTFWFTPCAFIFVWLATLQSGCMDITWNHSFKGYAIFDGERRHIFVGTVLLWRLPSLIVTMVVFSYCPLLSWIHLKMPILSYTNTSFFVSQKNASVCRNFINMAEPCTHAFILVFHSPSSSQLKPVYFSCERSTLRKNVLPEGKCRYFSEGRRKDKKKIEKGFSAENVENLIGIFFFTVAVVV